MDRKGLWEREERIEVDKKESRKAENKHNKRKAQERMRVTEMMRVFVTGEKERKSKSGSSIGR